MRYNYETIKKAGSVIRFVNEHLGISIKGDRCPAVWRGGTGDNVALTDMTYYDHKTKESGSLLDLCSITKYNRPFDTSNIQQADEVAEFLAKWLGVAPMPVKHTPSRRYEELIEDGYKEVNKYEYKDESGAVQHFTIRLEHETKKKTFLQGSPSGWMVKRENLILYNLAALKNAASCFIVEGEKDADTLNAIGLTATCIAGGARNWQLRFAETFKGKNVVISCDNDEDGQLFGKTVARDIIDVAKAVKIITPSSLPKGDVTDYLTKEEKTKADLFQVFNNAPVLTPTELEFEISEAKKANKKPLTNFYLEEKEIGRRAKQIKTPKQGLSLVQDIHNRFLGFPRKVGDVLFDHDKDTGEIKLIYNAPSLFAWMQSKSKNIINWSQGDSFTNKSEMLELLRLNAQNYESISYVPDYPKRNDVYYAHKKLPEPSEDHRYFNGFVDFFAPANDFYKVLLKAFIVSPLYFEANITRPLWVIDSEQGAGSGKTTLVELVANIYGDDKNGGQPSRTNRHELEKNYTELVKKLVSTTGRLSRVLLIDNITGHFVSPELADLITSSAITGKAPYGRGEETRPNNLTYVITANAAQLDNDLSVRAYFISLEKPKYQTNWKGSILAYIKKYRLNIIADIIDIISKHKIFNIEPQTRFPEYEQKILQAFCDDEKHFNSIIEQIQNQKLESNVDEDLAVNIYETLKDSLCNIHIDYTPIKWNEKLFITSDALYEFVKNAIDERPKKAIQKIRELAKANILKGFDPAIRRYPHNGNKRYSGIMWNPDKLEGEAKIITRINGKTQAGTK